MGVRPDIDRGYAWVILGACFFMYMLLLGSIKSFGVLYSEILTVTNSGAGSTALIGSAASFIQSLTGPFAILLATRYSFRLVCFCGGVALCIGYVSCAFTHDVMYWYITYSLITGIGCGLAYVPCSTLINYYFEHNRALANGIVLSASGVGGFLFPHIYHILIDQYAISGAMLVLGGVMANVCVAASFIRQPYEFSSDSSVDIKTKEKQNEYGWVEDLTGSWDNVFYITGILQLLAAIITFFVSRCSKSLDGHDDVEKEVKEPASEKLLEAGIKS
ncbi:monocarboxylate transporter 14-like isoform X3 [Saccostrea echinata]|uniref:monocarboxylate transporter 14-like isoform X3 n=1 Tax=Saccostrea echinata TaxID=191078 RepID=UPI002A7F90EE|nr:monocarboxylate transporter 14-like isoform X3 [Saccostrea echinata]